MSPETITRLRRLAQAGTPRVTIEASVLTALLDAVEPSDVRTQLERSAAQALPDAVRQRDAAVEALRSEQDWICALAEMLERKRLEIGGSVLVDAQARRAASDLGFGGASA